MASILIIDDDPKICLILRRMVNEMGHHSAEANTLKEGLQLCLRQSYDVIFLDLEFPDGNGLSVLPQLQKAHSMPEIIIITGKGNFERAEKAFKLGAWDYVTKPFVIEELSLPLTRTLQYRKEKLSNLRSLNLKRNKIIGASNALQACLDEVAKTSAIEASTLIEGETGTGKELFAHAIHENSSRAKGKFVAVDCGAIPENLAESTLFGHERGAFTGADKNRTGLILQADGGTLFLDEIGDLPLRIQTTLLRTLQERKIRPIGTTAEIPVDFRLIAATHRNLDQMVQNHNFRQDLLYRICTIKICLPPLRERKEDIRALVVHKLEQIAQQYNQSIKGVSPEFFHILAANNWSGNVRELMNIVEYAVSAAHNHPTLFPVHLPPIYRTAMLDNENLSSHIENKKSLDVQIQDNEFPSLSEIRSRTEKAYLLKIIQKAGGDRQKACRLLKISQSHLYGLLKKYNLTF